ncbi:ETHR [Carabus blaptoides fortunei]
MSERLSTAVRVLLIFVNECWREFSSASTVKVEGTNHSALITNTEKLVLKVEKPTKHAMISTIASLVASTTLNAADQPPAIDLNASTTTNYLYTTIDLGQNRTGSDQNDTYSPVIPTYIRNTSIVFCVIIMCLGVIGNIMVPIVIFKSKDMRNSTNIFLVNLSVADLMVLLVCTPTVLVEVNSQPDTWVLGEQMCKFLVEKP